MLYHVPDLDQGLSEIAKSAEAARRAGTQPQTVGRRHQGILGSGDSAYSESHLDDRSPGSYRPFFSGKPGRLFGKVVCGSRGAPWMMRSRITGSRATDRLCPVHVHGRQAGARRRSAPAIQRSGIRADTPGRRVSHRQGRWHPHRPQIVTLVGRAILKVKYRFRHDLLVHGYRTALVLKSHSRQFPVQTAIAMYQRRALSAFSISAQNNLQWRYACSIRQFLNLLSASLQPVQSSQRSMVCEINPLSWKTLNTACRFGHLAKVRADFRPRCTRTGAHLLHHKFLAYSLTPF